MYELFLVAVLVVSPMFGHLKRPKAVGTWCGNGVTARPCIVCTADGKCARE